MSTQELTSTNKIQALSVTSDPVTASLRPDPEYSRSRRGTMVVTGRRRGVTHIQLSAGRGIALPGNPAAKNEWRVREVGLARQSHSVLGLPPAFLLEHSHTAAHQLDLCLAHKKVQVLLDGSHYPRVRRSVSDHHLHRGDLGPGLERRGLAIQLGH